MSNKKREQKSIMQNLALLSQVGIMMIVPIFGGVFLGGLIDSKLNTGSIFLIVFIVLGVGAAFRNLYVLAMQKTKEYDQHDSPSTYVKKLEKKINSEKNKNDK